MELTKHCQICDYKEFDFQTGTSCSLNNQKPSFKEKCINILIDKNICEEITEKNVDLAIHKKQKTYITIRMIALTVVGLSIFIGGTLGLFKIFSSNSPIYLISGFPIIGLTVCAMGIRPYIKFKQKLVVLKDEKKELDELLELYYQNYTIDIDITEDIHGHENVKTEIKFT